MIPLTVFIIIVMTLFLAKPLMSLMGPANSTGKQTGKKNKNGDNTAKEGSPMITIVNKWDLPPALTEISGIAWISDNKFACVQDEEGTIFVYNTASSAIEKEIKFAGPGDYEGIALVNEIAYVMRADGMIFKVDNISSAQPVVKEYKTHLNAKNDVEGFTYDKNMNRLLAAMKGAEDGNRDFKGIYSFDLATHLMSTSPVYKLSIQGREPGTGKKKKGKGIQPSALSVHPLNNDLYIVDAGGPGLRILNQAGEEKSSYNFNRNDFPQPEGITFSPDGKLFISNEGKNGQGNILEVKISQ